MKRDKQEGNEIIDDGLHDITDEASENGGLITGFHDAIYLQGFIMVLSALDASENGRVFDFGIFCEKQDF